MFLFQVWQHSAEITIQVQTHSYFISSAIEAKQAFRGLTFAQNFYRFDIIWGVSASLYVNRKVIFSGLDVFP